MHFDINLRFQPSGAFVGILAELNEQFSEWTDGSYDWANQTVDFLHADARLPQFDEALFRTPLSQRAVNDVLHIAIAVLAGDFPRVRDYMKHVRFAFVIGYPRSGGSYLTKELLRTVGFDHTRVSEALAHDGFPDIRDVWYDWEGQRPYFHLQHSLFEVAEFLVIANYYYQLKSRRQGNGIWVAPKKMHKMVNWAGSFKMLLGKGHSDYLVTLRHPLPAAISIAEKSGGYPDNGLFPAQAPRSAIEHWVLNDLAYMGFDMEAVKKMAYFEAVFVGWTLFHMRMATSGLFLGDRHEIRLIPYGGDNLEGVVREYRERYGETQAMPEAFHIHDKAQRFTAWAERGDAAVAAVAAQWAALGLRFPALSLD